MSGAERTEGPGQQGFPGVLTGLQPFPQQRATRASRRKWTGPGSRASCFWFEGCCPCAGPTLGSQAQLPALSDQPRPQVAARLPYICVARRCLCGTFPLSPLRWTRARARPQANPRRFWTPPRAINCHCPPGPLPAVSKLTAAVGPDRAECWGSLHPWVGERTAGGLITPPPGPMTASCTVCPISEQKNSGRWLCSDSVRPGRGVVWLTRPIVRSIGL